MMFLSSSIVIVIMFLLSMIMFLLPIIKLSTLSFEEKMTVKEL